MNASVPNREDRITDLPEVSVFSPLLRFSFFWPASLDISQFEFAWTWKSLHGQFILDATEYRERCERRVKWKGGGRGKRDGPGNGVTEERRRRRVASRAQAILRTTQPLRGRTNCVGAQSRATRVEEGGKRLHNYPIQRTYPNPPFSRSLSLSHRARSHQARYVLTATIKGTDALTRATITAKTNIFWVGF